MRGAWAAVLFGLLALAAPAAARAQEGATPETIGTPDSLFSHPERIPLLYYTTYDRDIASGTWTQTLNYGLRRRRLALDLSGTAATSEDLLRANFAGHSGEFNAKVDYQLSPRWVLGVSGRSDANVSGGEASGTRLRQNRFEGHAQYTPARWHSLTSQTVISSEFRQDHTLSFQPIPLDTLARSGDTLQVYDRRDSTIIEGRLDRASTQLTWKPGRLKANATFLVTGSRLVPTTHSIRTTYGRSLLTGAPADSTDRLVPSQEPITTGQLQAELGFSGLPRVKAGVRMMRLWNEDLRFDQYLRDQEHSTANQSTGTLHLESVSTGPFTVVLDGTSASVLNLYRLRSVASGLVATKSFGGTASYTQPKGNATVHFEVARSEGSRQKVNLNGTTISRFLTAAVARQVSSRMRVDGTGTASIQSFRYVYPPGREPFSSDQDNARWYFNLGTGYSISPRCSTTVRFSTNRQHRVAIGADAAGSNNVLTNYQMDATLLLLASRQLTVRQTYSLSAVYTLYDYSETRNTLSRIRRIDTTVTDTIFAPVFLSLVHNFQYFDVGTYQRDPERGRRLYAVSTESYQQNLLVSLALQPTNGVSGFVTQNLWNTRSRSLYGGTEQVSNRWTLTFGGEITRSLSSTAEFRAVAKHTGEYSERPPGCDESNPASPCGNFVQNRRDYWVVSTSLQKNF